MALLLAGVAGSVARAETSHQRAKRVVDEASRGFRRTGLISTMQNRVETGRIYSSYNEKVSGMATDALIYDLPIRGRSAGGGLPGVRCAMRAAGSRRCLAQETGRCDSVYGRSGLRGHLSWRPSAVGFRGAAVQKSATLHNIFYILRERLGEPGLVFDSRGSDFFENRPVEIVDIADANNDHVTVYFDQINKLPTRQRIYTRKDPIDNSKVEEAATFDKYRDVGRRRDVALRRAP